MPPVRLSLPVPPSSVSLPSLPARLSLPVPPASESLPARPLRLLLPLLPVIVLASALPVPLRLLVPVSTSLSSSVASVQVMTDVTVSTPPPLVASMVWSPLASTK